MKKEYVDRILAIKDIFEYNEIVGDFNDTYWSICKRINEVNSLAIRRPVKIRMEPSLYFRFILSVIPVKVFFGMSGEEHKVRFIDTTPPLFRGYPVEEDESLTGYYIDFEDIGDAFSVLRSSRAKHQKDIK